MNSLKTTIAARKKTAGWINSDARKRLVFAGALRPGNTNGEKCMCCKRLNMNMDRCELYDIPTSVNSYCKSFGGMS